MYTNCDEIFKVTIPATRVVVAKSLSKRYKMNQSEIAKRLGIAQAAVNKYLKSKYSEKIAKMEKMITARGLASSAIRTARSSSDQKAISMAIDQVASNGHLVRAALSAAQ